MIDQSKDWKPPQFWILLPKVLFVHKCFGKYSGLFFIFRCILRKALYYYIFLLSYSAWLGLSCSFAHKIQQFFGVPIASSIAYTTFPHGGCPFCPVTSFFQLISLAHGYWIFCLLFLDVSVKTLSRPVGLCICFVNLSCNFTQGVKSDLDLFLAAFLLEVGQG